MSKISGLTIRNHPILKNLDLDFINPETKKPYLIVVFVGENGCGKTTLLNELFSYSSSQYIVNKEINAGVLANNGIFLATFLRQGQLYYSSMDHIAKLIDGSGPAYPSESTELQENRVDTNPYPGSERSNVLYAVSELPDLSIFDDNVIEKLFNENHKTFIPGGKVSALINGQKGNDSYDRYSSGQQELIFKLQTIKNLQSCSDFLLMDEPETSLHPRWQKIIIDYITSCISVSEDVKPQIFIATHSEKILESVIKKNDTLIIRLFKDNNKNIAAETIPQMHLLLRRPSFAELDYVIFKIDSYEYCNELFDLLEWLYGVSGDRGVDRRIQRSEFYDDSIHHKEWFNDKFNEITCYTLPVYVRNYFHHPKDKKEPTSDELHIAIELLRNIVLNLNKK